VRLFIRMGAKSELELFSTLARLWLGLGGACDDFNRDVELWLERLRHRPQITRLALRLKRETVRHTPPHNADFTVLRTVCWNLGVAHWHLKTRDSERFHVQ
jgi:hypothetical protein